MVEHPIIFLTELVRAILDDRKTQTRRIMKPQPEFRLNKIVGKDVWCWGKYLWGATGLSPNVLNINDDSPYGKVGDTLWVRETFGFPNHFQDKRGRITYSYAERHLLYKADYPQAKHPEDIDTDKGYVWRKSWRSPYHMPRWAARIFLEITNIRVERVQDIAYEDCEAEGITQGIYADENTLYDCKGIFKKLWDSINAKRGYGWDKNPWVWVIEFRQALKGK